MKRTKRASDDHGADAVRRRGEIEVHVTVSTEAIDFEEWARNYVRALFEAQGYPLPVERAA